MCKTVLERATRIELVFTTEKAIVLQLNYAHIAGENQKNPRKFGLLPKVQNKKRKSQKGY